MLFPPSFLNRVVAIGVKIADDKIKWIASGFLYGHYLHEEDNSHKMRIPKKAPR